MFLKRQVQALFSEKIDFLIAAGIFVLLAMQACFPLFEALFNWPPLHSDGNEIMAHLALQRSAMIHYNQLPFWSPSLGGGQELLAMPHSQGLSPFFIAILLLGEAVGVKAWIFSQMFIGLMGMWMLSKEWGCKRVSAYLPSVVFFGGTFFSLQMAEGLYYLICIAWIPWAVLFYSRSLSSQVNCFWTACIGVWILLDGGLYPCFVFLLIFLALYSCIEAINKKSLNPVRVFLTVSILILFLGLFKWLALVDYFSRHFFLYSHTPTDLHILKESLFSRMQLLSRREIMGGEIVDIFWEKHGAYIGISASVVYLLSLRPILQKHFALVATGILFLLGVCVDSLLFTILKAMNQESVYAIVPHFSSRLIWMFLFSFALVCGLGLSRLEERKVSFNKPFPSWVIGLVIVLIGWELISVSRPILKEAFPRVPEVVNGAAPFVQSRKEVAAEKRDFLTTVLSNKGLAVDVLYKNDLFLCHAVPYGAPRYKGELYVDPDDPSAIRRVDFSPNVIHIDVNVSRESELVLNQNYDPNWRVKGLRSDKVLERDGLVSARIEPGDRGMVTFYYFPFFFYLGGGCSVIFFILFILFFRKRVSSVVLFASIIIVVLCAGILSVAEINRRGNAGKLTFRPSDAVKGLLLFRQGRPLEARPYLESASQIYPNSLMLHSMLKDIYEKAGMDELTVHEQLAIDELTPHVSDMTR